MPLKMKSVLTKLKGMDRFELASEFGLRIFLFIYYWLTTILKPRQREIHEEEWWLYMNPRSNSYFPYRMLLVLILINTMTFIFAPMFTNKGKYFNLVISTALGYTLTILLNSSITNTLKLLVGRPRPDFYYRCYPDGNKANQCTGEEDDIIEGSKSFPSGHSSLSLAAFGFTALFLLGQFRLLASQPAARDGGEKSLRSTPVVNKYIGPKFILSMAPLFLGMVISVSRLIDFHHHFEDIAVGAGMGFGIGFLCYRLYFPSIFSASSDHCRYAYDEYPQSTVLNPFPNV